MASLINAAPPALRITPPDHSTVDEADAYSTTRANLSDWLAGQRAEAVRAGLADPETGLPTKAGLINAAQQVSSALLMGTTAPGRGIVAYHGSPHDFSAFDMSKIGTGEGAQAYGHGLYFAGNEGTAGQYRSLLSQAPRVNGQLVGEADGAAPGYLYRAQGQIDDAIQAAQSDLARLQQSDTKIDQFRAVGAQRALDQLADWKAKNAVTPPGGRMYEVNLNVAPEQLLDWDKPLAEQSPQVQQALRQAAAAHLAEREGGPPLRTAEDIAAGNFGNYSGDEAYSSVGGYKSGDVASAASQRLNQAGIPGIQYLDAGSRAAGEGSRNYVMFDPSLISIARKYAIPLTALSGTTPGLLANEDTAGK